MAAESPCPDGLPVPEWQKAELGRRRQEDMRHPESAMPRSEVERSILEAARKTRTDKKSEN